MARVVHFEIHAENTARAKAFYEGVFGWVIEKWEGAEEYYLITTGDDAVPGINGGLMKRKAPLIQESIMAYVCTIDVTEETLDSTLAKIQANGGTQVMPKTAVPKVGYLAYCKDPEKNVFGLMEANEAAA